MIVVSSRQRHLVHEFRGGTIKITVWLVTRERATWISAGEILGLAGLLFFDPGATIRLFVGLPLLAHLGYTAMTSLPMGSIPGRPLGTSQQRRNPDLRSRVVGFLNEVRRVEDYAQRARTAGLPQRVIEENLRSAQRRMMAAAGQVTEVMGRSTSTPSHVEPSERRRPKVLTHEKPRQAPASH